MIISLRPDDFPKVMKLDGFQFAGTVLKIEPTSGDTKPADGNDETHSSETIDMLKTFLSRRYDPDSKLLDLSNLSTDPDLINMGMFNTISRESKFFPALMKVCDSIFPTILEKEEAVLSVSLANNGLSDVRSVTTLAQTLPTLKNLDLSMNNIKNLADIDAWRWKFRKLEHLVLSGNPLESNEPDLKGEICRWYPSLLLLNNARVRTDEEALANTKNNTPLPIAGPSFRDEASIAENFLKSFFPAYDSDRSSLVKGYYDSLSSFSLSINTSAPRNESQPTAPWDQYIKKSRNLTKLDYTSAQMSRLYTGIDDVGEVFSTLPATKHPDLTTEAQKWCLECHTVPGLPDPVNQSRGGVGGLIVMVHGQFFEIDISTNQSKGVRSFDRTFVLGPGSGVGGIRVANDILVIRAFGGHDAWKAQDSESCHESRYQAAGSSHQIVLPDGFGTTGPGKTQEQVQKEVLAAELSKATGMTIEYSVMCLEQSAWNLEGAAAAFEQAKVIFFAFPCSRERMLIK